MTIIKVPKQYLINEDQDSITLNLPDDFLNLKINSIDYNKVKKVQGILKKKKDDLINYSQKIRQEWE